MGNAPSAHDIEYSAPSKEFKEKMSQMGINMPDLHKEYNLPRKYRSYEHFQKKLLTKVNDWEEGKTSDESFFAWQNKIAAQVAENNPSLQILFRQATNNDVNYVKTDERRPELTHLLHGIASQYNEEDINHYLHCQRTNQNNNEFTLLVDSKVASISDNAEDLPEWVISQRTAQTINQAIDRRINRALNPDNFRRSGDAGYQQMGR